MQQIKRSWLLKEAPDPDYSGFPGQAFESCPKCYDDLFLFADGYWCFHCFKDNNGKKCVYDPFELERKDLVERTNFPQDS